MSDFQEQFFRHAVYSPVVYLRGQWVPMYLRRLMRTQFVPRHKLMALQNRLLASQLNYVARQVPYYRTLRLRDATEHSARALLDDIPTITKSTLRSDEGRFRSEESHHFLTPKTTGGSTGQPMTIWKTREAMAWELAAMHRGYAWAGVNIGDRQARFWGVPRDDGQIRRARLIDKVTNRLRMSAFAFTEEDLNRYCRQLQRFRPTYVYGYVSMLDEFAAFLMKTGNSIGSIRCVISTAEVLSYEQRVRIAEGFAAHVFNEYGCGELGTIAHECPSGRMHLSVENMIVEVMRGNEVCDVGEEGELVVTELHNRAMPLIRYRTGDVGVLSPESCECGRSLPFLLSVKGRAYDMVMNSRGQKFHPEAFMYIVEDAKRRNLGIGGFQVIQHRDASLEFRIVRDAAYSGATEEFITRKVHEVFEPGVTVQFTDAQFIDREASGKMRLVRSEMGQL